MEYITVKELFKITKGKKVEEIDYKNENSIRYIQIDDLRNNNNIKHCENINKYVIAKKEDIIIAWDGANAGTIGFGIEGAIGSTLAILRKENKEMDTEFCGLFLRSKSAYLREKCTGATIPHIQRRALEDIKIPKISLNKQIEIKNIINKAQELIDKRKEQIQDLDELVKSQFIEMFGDPILNKKGWETKLLGEVCEMKAGKNIKAADIYPENIGKLYPCYGGNGLRGYVKEYSHDGNIPLIGRQGALCGNVKYAQGKFYATEHAVVTQPKIEMNSYWLYFILEQLDLNRLSTGAAQPGLTVGKLNKVELPIAPIGLQNKFEEFALQADKLKFEMEKSLKELEDNFNALMQKAFNGELFN
ncbi:restriction endonuclease subunit S [Clostridium cuniculi]|uniref:restriction endonuclease subunit S n=1 Tax=Clostridium cuniculi TaxID=2548455 RepID=UPI0018AC8365|nr:restriction endonuclease subunit S [Clostridium cuniculi]